MTLRAAATTWFPPLPAEAAGAVVVPSPARPRTATALYSPAVRSTRPLLPPGDPGPVEAHRIARQWAESIYAEHRTLRRPWPPGFPGTLAEAVDRVSEMRAESALAVARETWARLVAYDADFILCVLRVVADAELCSLVWWRCDGERAPITFFVGCNDLFAWGTADAEPLTPQNIGELERAIADVRATGSLSASAPDLFCCRMRGMRPQGAAYPKLAPAVWPLLDACGPERVVDVLNPKPRTTP